MTDDELREEIAKIPYFYHKIELRPGITTPGWAPISPAAYRIPSDLSRKLVLDIGAWDGYWSIEAVKRGAYKVYALENFSDTVGSVTNADRSTRWNNLKLCLDALNICNVQMLDGDIEDLATFENHYADNVFCFGVLYHLKNPLRGLLNMKELCTGTIHIETAILDGCKSAYTDSVYEPKDNLFEFYPHDQYGLNHSNWWVGTLRAWCGLVEAAGFRNIESWRLTESPRTLAEARGFIRATI